MTAIPAFILQHEGHRVHRYHLLDVTPGADTPPDAISLICFACDAKLTIAADDPALVNVPDAE